ncbi:MAG: hypothetical protein NTX24_01435 [Candidatus Pacearchaeota archaeon]|nr:hypothetical protein [Candidatus Pacearchaeota archaeon]
MGWYGNFLVPELKLLLCLSRVDQGVLSDNFDSLDKFFNQYEKLEDDINYVEEAAEENKTFSAKAVAKMFSITDTTNHLTGISDSLFLLYFLHKLHFEIEHKNEEELDSKKLQADGWKIITP